MLCLEVHVNGQKVCTAGVDDGLVNATVDVVGPRWTGAPEMNATAEDAGLLRLVVAGVSQERRGLDLVRWSPGRRLSIGDVVSVKILSSESAEAPVEREPYETL